MALRRDGQLTADPEVELIGIPELSADRESMAELAYQAVMQTFDSLPRPRRRDPDSVIEAVQQGVRAAIASRWGKKPMCIVHVLEV
jgi:ribonuclease J